MSIDKLINDAIDGVIDGKDISCLLSQINDSDSDLSSWFYELTSNSISEYYEDEIHAIINFDEILEDLHEHLAELYGIEYIKDITDIDISKYISYRFSNIFNNNELEHLEIYKYKNVYIFIIGCLEGQGGIGYKSFGIAKFKEEIFSSFESSKYLLNWDSMPVDKKNKYIKLFRNYIYQHDK
jgi:hypothetical protein